MKELQEIQKQMAQFTNIHRWPQLLLDFCVLFLT